MRSFMKVHLKSSSQSDKDERQRKHKPHHSELHLLSHNRSHSDQSPTTSPQTSPKKTKKNAVVSLFTTKSSRPEEVEEDAADESNPFVVTLPTATITTSATATITPKIKRKSPLKFPRKMASTSNLSAEVPVHSANYDKKASFVSLTSTLSAVEQQQQQEYAQRRHSADRCVYGYPAGFGPLPIESPTTIYGTKTHNWGLDTSREVLHPGLVAPQYAKIPLSPAPAVHKPSKAALQMSVLPPLKPVLLMRKPAPMPSPADIVPMRVDTAEYSTDYTTESAQSSEDVASEKSAKSAKSAASSIVPRRSTVHFAEDTIKEKNRRKRYGFVAAPGLSLHLHDNDSKKSSSESVENSCSSSSGEEEDDDDDDGSDSDSSSQFSFQAYGRNASIKYYKSKDQVQLEQQNTELKKNTEGFMQFINSAEPVEQLDDDMNYIDYDANDETDDLFNREMFSDEDSSPMKPAKSISKPAIEEEEPPAKLAFERLPPQPQDQSLEINVLLQQLQGVSLSSEQKSQGESVKEASLKINVAVPEVGSETAKEPTTQATSEPPAKPLVAPTPPPQPVNTSADVLALLLQGSAPKPTPSVSGTTSPPVKVEESKPKKNDSVHLPPGVRRIDSLKYHQLDSNFREDNLDKINRRYSWLPDDEKEDFKQAERSVPPVTPHSAHLDGSMLDEINEIPEEYEYDDDDDQNRARGLYNGSSVNSSVGSTSSSRIKLNEKTITLFSRGNSLRSEPPASLSGSIQKKRELDAPNEEEEFDFSTTGGPVAGTSLLTTISEGSPESRRSVVSARH